MDQAIPPIFSIHKDGNHVLISNSNYLIAIPNILPFSKVGPIWIRWKNSWRYSGDYFEVKFGSRPLSFISITVLEDGSEVKRLLLKSKRNIDLELALHKEKDYITVSYPTATDKKKARINLSINFDELNSYDYVNFSGNLYKRVKKPLHFSLKVPYTGAFAQTWAISSKKCVIGLVGVANSYVKKLSAKLTGKNSRITLESEAPADHLTNIYLILGLGNYALPIKTKFMELDPIQPLPLRYKDELKDEALKSFRALRKYFLLKTPNGKVPANFIFPPEKENQSFTRMPFGSFGNCFSLGFIYGTSALYQWTQNERVLETLVHQFLPPVLKGGQIKEGPVAGAFFETYNGLTRKWTTGRVQFPTGGYSDWFPFPPDRGGNAGQAVVSLPKRELSIGGLPYLFSTMLFTLRQTIKSLPYLFKRIPKLVIFPVYSGQFAYSLLQVYSESLTNGHFLGSKTEVDINESLNLTSNFLQEYQRADSLWDHELFDDGTIFWNKRTLACVYPATFLYWWGHLKEDMEIQKQARKALTQCMRLITRGEFHGVYFETNLAINQDDLVTGLACIKCFTRLFELTHNTQFLDHARTAAWHVLSYMWGNGIYDRLNNCITGGVPVTTYKGLGFPVIGGSELCQTIVALLELSQFDQTFFPYAEAALGYHSQYLYESNRHIGATHEIIWGIGENWSTSTSVDFASYATGPFIRALYLYEKLKREKK